MSDSKVGLFAGGTLVLLAAAGIGTYIAFSRNNNTGNLGGAGIAPGDNGIESSGGYNEFDDWSEGGGSVGGGGGGGSGAESGGGSGAESGGDPGTNGLPFQDNTKDKIGPNLTRDRKDRAPVDPTDPQIPPLAPEEKPDTKAPAGPDTSIGQDKLSRQESQIPARYRQAEISIYYPVFNCTDSQRSNNPSRCKLENWKKFLRSGNLVLPDKRPGILDVTVPPACRYPLGDSDIRTCRKWVEYAELGTPAPPRPTEIVNYDNTGGGTSSTNGSGGTTTTPAPPPPAAPHVKLYDKIDRLESQIPERYKQKEISIYYPNFNCTKSQASNNPSRCKLDNWKKFLRKGNLVLPDKRPGIIDLMVPVECRQPLSSDHIKTCRKWVEYAELGNPAPPRPAELTTAPAASTAIEAKHSTSGIPGTFASTTQVKGLAGLVSQAIANAATQKKETIPFLHDRAQVAWRTQDHIKDLMFRVDRLLELTHNAWEFDLFDQLIEIRRGLSSGQVVNERLIPTLEGRKFTVQRTSASEEDIKRLSGLLRKRLTTLEKRANVNPYVLRQVARRIEALTEQVAAQHFDEARKNLLNAEHLLRRVYI